MEVHLSPENEAQLSKLAAEKGCDADSLAEAVLTGYLRGESHFVEAVKAGEAAIARGEYLSHEEVGKRITRLLRS